MPYMVDVLGVELRADGADPEDVERATEWLSETEDLSADDLRRLVETCVRDAPSVAVYVVARGEERELVLYVGAKGKVEVHVVASAEKQLAKYARDLATSGDITVTGTPKQHSAARKEREQLAADVDAAIDAKDTARMMTLLADPRLAGSVHGKTRAWLAQHLGDRSTPAAHTLLLRHLRDDVHDVAHAIMYRLQRQKGIEAAYLAELERLARDLPRTRVPFDRFLAAVNDYGLEVTIPDGLVPPPPPSRKRADAIDDAVGELERGGASLVRKAKRNLAPPLGEELQGKLRERFASRLIALATRGPSIQTRGIALDLLELLGLERAELRSCVDGLPERGVVLELLHDASELPQLPVVPFREPAPRFDGRDVAGAAPYEGDAWLVVPRGDTVRFVVGGTSRWTTRLGVDVRPLKIARGGRGDLVFVASAWGVHALDAATGSERWVCPHVADARPGGNLVDPHATVWDRDDDVVVQAARQVATLDRASGAVRAMIETTFPLFGLRSRGDGVLALDGLFAVGDFDLGAPDELADSGLVLHPDGRTEDIVAPRCLQAVVREANGVRLELTRDVAVVDAGGRRTLYRAPQRVRAVGHVESTDKGVVVPLKIQPASDVVYGNGRWHAFVLHA